MTFQKLIYQFFKALDKDNSGYITEKEMRLTLASSLNIINHRQSLYFNHHQSLYFNNHQSLYFNIINHYTSIIINHHTSIIINHYTSTSSIIILQHHQSSYFNIISQSSSCHCHNQLFIQSFSVFIIIVVRFFIDTIFNSLVHHIRYYIVLKSSEDA